MTSINGLLGHISGFFGHPTEAAPPPKPSPVPEWRNPTYGTLLPVVIGTARTKGQLVWYGPTEDETTVYSYIGEVLAYFKARLVATSVYAISEAPVADVIRLWKGRVPGAGMTVANWDYIAKAGTVEFITAATATAWSALAGTDAEGMGFSGTCHARISHLILNPDGAAPDVSYEVKSLLADAASPDGGKDTLAADAVKELLTNTKWGFGISASLVDVEYGADGTLASGFRRWCEQRGLWVSRAIESKEQKSDILESLLTATDATLVRIDGKYRVIPLADRAVGTFAPYLTAQPISDSNDDFLGSGSHIEVERLNPGNYTVWPVSYLSRAQNYDQVQVEGFDQAAIADGQRRAPVLDVPWVISDAHACWLADTLALRALTTRNEYTLRLIPRWNAILLPSDFISVTESNFALSGRLMRVTSVKEGEDGSCTVQAVEWSSIQCAIVSRQPAAGLLNTNIVQPVPATSGQADAAQAAADAALAGALAPNPNFDEDAAPTWPTMTRIAKASAPTGCPTEYCGRTQARDAMSATDGPVTPGKQVYVEAWIDITQSVHGAHFGLAFLDSTGSYITWLGALAPSTTAWARYSDVVTVPAGAVRARGWCQIDAVDTFGSVYFTGLRVSEATAAQIAADAAHDAAVAAQADATQALGELTDIASDSLLTPVEKPPVIRDYAVITAEQSGIDAQATAYGITGLKTTYDNAVAALTTYLNGLTTPVAWNNLTGNTTIVGATFRTKFADVYAARQALLDGIAANSFTRGEANATSDRDNVWPNPTSEIAPPAGADASLPEWKDRYNAGPPPTGAYSGSWVRQAQAGAALSGFWLPCSPGAMFYAEAQGRRTAGTATGGRLRIQFYSEYGNFGSGLGTASSSANVTSGTWGKVAVTSVVAPAAATAVHIGYWADSGDTVQFDALYARRVVGYPVVSSDVVSLTMGTGWTLSSGDVRKVGGLICGYVSLQVDATGSWTSILTFPTDCRPPNGFSILGMVQDATGPVLYVGRFSLTTAGVLALTYYDNGTSLISPPFAIGNGDQVGVSFAFPWV